ncbi:DUF4097 domain-containing protein [Candidatus Aminicenantes bacterium AC-334-K16]|jgi:hypothetical protein|nr:DUF4097 domain-containing protein [Candidatus Aminicenantes bacterium AC-334-K16]
MKIRIILSVFLLLSTSLLFALEKKEFLTLGIEGINLLEIDNGAGFLEVKGVPGLSRIEVEAEIIVRGMNKDKALQFINERLDLRLEKLGNRAQLIGKFKPTFSLFNWGEKFCNLTVRLPQEMNLAIDDSSGSIVIENLQGNLKIDDSSGSIQIDGITGEVEIEDGSGNLKVSKVQGTVFIDDGSGEILLKDITGEVRIDDGSGEIHVSQVKGRVVISDGSGSIWVDKVEQDVIIKQDGSGKVYITQVKGRVIK